MGPWKQFARKNLDQWLPHYVQRALGSAWERSRTEGPEHILVSVCDHFEPLFGGASDSVGHARVAAWLDGYPRLAERFRDVSGRPPRHTFFLPGEQLRSHWLDGFAQLARAGLCEVELHLHHDGDDAASLREDIVRHLDVLARHGHLSRTEGRPRFGFIHGNWCLANAREDRRYCGVDSEVDLLFELGCYADFTFPAADDPSQPRQVNTIGWPTGDRRRRRAYEDLERARVGTRHRDRMLFVQGPTNVSLRARWPPLGIESGALTAAHPASSSRVARWPRFGATVAGRPEWIFVKLHAHGAPERDAGALLGDGGSALHEWLGIHCNDGVRRQLHYLTARETFNLACAAMDGKTGDPSRYLDYVLPPPPL